MRVFVIAVLSLALFAGQAVAEDKKEMSEKEKLSYSIGYSQGSSMAGFFKTQSVDIDTNSMVEAFKAGLSGTKAALSEQNMREIIAGFQKDLSAKQAERMKWQNDKNQKAGEAFLAENKKKEGVVTTQSGLQYKVLKEGAGETPKATDKVKVNYKGTLIDGKEFDMQNGAVFQVNAVIPGWTEALQLMKVGSKWEVFIPANLAYGARGSGPMIAPNSALIFEVELVSIEK